MKMRYYTTLQYARENRKNQTEAEKCFWENVRGRKLFGLKFNRQFLIEYDEKLGNKLFYIADFHNFEHKLIIEIDGEIHLKQQEYDKEREDNIKALGYEVIRFTNEEVIKNWKLIETRIETFLTNNFPPLFKREGPGVSSNKQQL